MRAGERCGGEAHRYSGKPVSLPSAMIDSLFCQRFRIPNGNFLGKPCATMSGMMFGCECRREGDKRLFPSLGIPRHLLLLPSSTCESINRGHAGGPWRKMHVLLREVLGACSIPLVAA